uniref:Uncharacterized protein n=1 Tax=Dromaius novaehollandiae TaxID=8790 RepID=A0A8C4IW04_DRONO
MNFHALKEDGNQNPGMETENQVKNLVRFVLVQITLLMMDTLQLTENVLLRSRAWTWPRYHHANGPGMMDQGPLTTEKWMLQVDLQRREGKDEEVQDLHRECQNLGGMKLSVEALQEAITLPEEEGVGAIGEEEVT